MRVNPWLLAIPLAFALNHFGASPIVVFAASGLAIIPLALLMEKSTEALAHYLGPTAGGLLSATMGNAPELIIGIAALRNGLVDMLKGSIAGSIIGTLLFGVGMAMIFGGYKRPLQSFDGDMVSINGSLLTLAAFGLVVPAVFHFSNQVNQEISLEISVILLVIYFASLVFTLTTAGRPHTVQCGIVPVPETKELEREIHEVEEALPDWSRSKALLILGAVAVALAFTSDLLTDSIQPASSALGLSPSFAGIFLLAMVGNVPQYMNSVSFAAKNRMTLALSINLGSTTQLVLLVAPILVIAGTLMGIPMDLLFSYFELVAILLSVIITRSLISDNTSNWLEGVMLVGVYVMLAVGFYYAPN